MTEDEKKLMDLFLQVTRACYDGDRAALDELRDQILAHYRASRAVAGSPTPVFEGTRFYLDKEGGKWVVDPHGTHGWWSCYPGEWLDDDDGRPWARKNTDEPHGTPCGDGGVLRYYRRVG